MEYKKNNIRWHLIIAFLIGFTVSAILYTMVMVVAGTALHFAQNHNH